MKQVLEKEPNHAEAIANSVVLSVIAGKDASEFRRY